MNKPGVPASGTASLSDRDRSPVAAGEKQNDGRIFPQHAFSSNALRAGTACGPALSGSKTGSHCAKIAERLTWSQFIHWLGQPDRYAMSNPLDEVRYIQLYCELTGASEAQARSAFIFACCAEDSMSAGEQTQAVPYRADPKWEEEYSYEPAAKSRPVSYVHQLPGATRERFA